MRFFETDDEQRVIFDDGTYLFLLKRNISSPEFEGTSQDYARNVFRIGKSGDMLWRIKTERDYRGSPFRELFVNEDPRLMYNSSGFRYLVDLETGEAKTYDYPLLGPWKKRPLPLEYPSKRNFGKWGEQRVYLDDGTYLFLAQRSLGYAEAGLTAEDYARNVFRMTEDGEILWRVKTERDHLGSPFIELFEDENPCKVANWDGFKYLVNLETGEAEPYGYSR